MDLLVARVGTHTPTMQYGVFASRWPLADRTLWTIVNRTTYNIDGPQLRVPAQSGMRYFDLWNGKELKVQNDALTFPIEALGFAAILAQPAPADTAFLAEWPSSAPSRSPRFPRRGSTFLSSPCRSLPPSLPRRLLPAWSSSLPTAPSDSKSAASKSKAPTISVWTSSTPWEDSPRRHHSRAIDIASFFIDEYPVTNQQFAAFLAATKYQPADDHNFLRDWTAGRYPAG